METSSSTTTTTVTPTATSATTTTRSTKKPLIIGLVLLAILLVVCCGVGAVLFFKTQQDQAAKGKTCQYNGTTYSEGTGFKSIDGCNTCSCTNGEAVCTLMACNTGTNPEPTPTPAPNPSGTEETAIGKLQVTSSDYFYGTTPYPAAVLELKGSNLQAITCSDRYSTFASSTFTTDGGETLSDAKVMAFLNSMSDKERVGAVSFCVTAEGKYVVEYEKCTEFCGGGIGTVFYFGILSNNALVKETSIPNQLGAYPACDKSLALTKDNEFYVKCVGGETRDTAAIYKIFLDNGNYTEIVKADY